MHMKVDYWLLGREGASSNDNCMLCAHTTKSMQQDENSSCLSILAEPRSSCTGLKKSLCSFSCPSMFHRGPISHAIEKVVLAGAHGHNMITLHN